jgi:hypothetical protein
MLKTLKMLLGARFLDEASLLFFVNDDDLRAQKSGGVLDRIYRGGVRSGIPAG